ncbi:MAG: sigma-70 family RNA polymerase sigma factor [Solibacillus sp.]
MDKYEHLDTLYRQYMKSLYYYLYKMCGNAELAEDLVQETFVRATIHLYEADVLHAKAWLFQVARNTYLDEWRKIERRRKNPLFQLFLKPRDMCSPYGLPEQEVINKESAATVQSLLVQLPENYRTVYILREDEQFSYREISQLLRISEGNVKILLHRARKK